MKKAVCSIFLFISQLAMAETATFAAGCFWGVEEQYRKIPGVIKTQVGFIGGTLQNPKYEDTHDGKFGHAEAVEIEFDAKRVTLNRQGNDEGTQYRSGIYYHSEQQKKAAEAFIAKVKNPGGYDNHFMRKISFDSGSER